MTNNTDNKTSWLQQWLERVWYENGKGLFLLLPFSALYCVVSAYRRKTQSQSQPRLSCPVIVVGNITVGGTGKTPLTIHIVKLLQKAGYKPAIITRGYGGKATNWPQSVTAVSDAGMVGDEAVLMAINTGVPVYAGADRLESVRQLMEVEDCDVIVSDDGLQHYRLPRDIQIAVIDGERQFGNGLCLPAGPLREKKERLNDFDLMVVNTGSNKQNHWYSMNMKGDTLINLKTHAEIPLDDFDDKKVHALTGIGNPQRFFSSLEKHGLDLIRHSFPDHYNFIQSDLNFNDQHAIIMTEKDAVKCSAFASEKDWYLPVVATINENFDTQLLSLLEDTRDQKSRLKMESHNKTL